MRHDFMNTVTKKKESITLNKAFMSPCLLFHVILEIISFIFHLSLCTIRKQAFCNSNVAKSIKIHQDYKVVPWKYQAVLEIWRWCWKVKKVVLRHSKMGRGEHCSRYMFLKLPKTIPLVRKIWFFRKVLRIQDGQEYLSIKIVSDTNLKLYSTPYSTALSS